MNIFEFLGLDKDHRKGRYVTQHVKHFDEVPESKKSWPMLGQVKKDGVYAMAVKTAHAAAIFSRTGKHFTNLERLESKIRGYLSNKMQADVVYLAELCNDDCSLEVLSGLVNPNRKKALTDEQIQLMSKTYLSFHDAIPACAYVSGYYATPYSDRYSWLRATLPTEFDALDVVLLMNKKDADEYTNLCIIDGEEGAVFKQYDDKMSDWKAGHKGYRMMKKVRGVDYDLLCIDAEEGKGKYEGLVANLSFKWKKGKEIKCMLGKGWTHEAAKEMWVRYMCSQDETPIGKIFQVYALQESSKGKLRIPKVGELRFDKYEPDV